MKIPSIKTIATICDAQTAKTVRRLMEEFRDKCPDGRLRPIVTLNAISSALNLFGVESIPRGHNAHSPAIEYVNTGETYQPTVLWINGRFSIGDWGSIVERGNYD